MKLKKILAAAAAAMTLLSGCGGSSESSGSGSSQNNTEGTNNMTTSARDNSSQSPEADEIKEPKSIKLMAAGDSITDGFWLEGGYRVTLCDLLEENGYSQYVDFVGNKQSGNCYDGDHCGYTAFAIDQIPASESVTGARSGITRFIKKLVPEYEPDVVLLQIGTNDILSLYKLDEAGTRLENLVDIFLENIPEDGMLFLATIPYMDATDNTYIPAEYFTVEDMDKYVDDYNAKVKEIVEKKQAQGKNIELADVNSVLTKEDLYDGVHPSEEGYKKLGEFWYEKVKDFITE